MDLTRSVILLNKDGSLDTVSQNGDTYLSKVMQEAGDDASFLTFIDIDDDGKLDFIMQK